MEKKYRFRSNLYETPHPCLKWLCLLILIENKIISIHNNQPIELFTQSSLALSLYVDHSTGAGIAVIFIY